jgi:CP family cyanate transporter-like MFS transporter
VRSFFDSAKFGSPVYLAAINMRTGLAVITPIITIIGKDLGLSTIELAWLAAIPVLCFSLLSPVAVWLNRLGSVDRVISVAMWGLAISLLLRSTGSVFALFLFTALMGICIAILNVTLPAWVKLHGGSHTGVITGTYVMLMGIVSSIALWLAAPLSSLTRFSWQLAMFPWALLALFSAVWWQVRLRDKQLLNFDQSSRATWFRLLRNARAWQITLFFGFQSMNAYAGGTWIPTILLDRGFGLVAAGSIVAVIGLATAIAATYVPQLATNREDQRWILWIFSAVTAIGYLGLLLDAGWRLIFWVLLALLGQAATFPLSLILVVLRSNTTNEAQALSTMMQSVGYLIAATGPLSIGLLFQVFGSWGFGLAAMIFIVGIQAVMAAGAGRPGSVSA